MKFQKDEYVRVVAKNRDYLIGFLDSMNAIKDLSDVLKEDPAILDSQRFGQYLPDGSKREDRTVEEIREILKNYRESFHVKENEQEDEEEDFDEEYFTVSCACGNHYVYYGAEEIPKEDLHCGICGKLLIYYSGIDDYNFVYNGPLEKVGVEFEEDGEESSDEGS
jgi:ribosomal protein S27E